MRVIKAPQPVGSSVGNPGWSYVCNALRYVGEGSAADVWPRFRWETIVFAAECGRQSQARPSRPLLAGVRRWRNTGGNPDPYPHGMWRRHPGPSAVALYAGGWPTWPAYEIIFMGPSVFIFPMTLARGNMACLRRLRRTAQMFEIFAVRIAGDTRALGS